MSYFDEQISNDILNKYNQYSEHLLSVNEFNKPKVMTGPYAICYKIIELILMRPGTYPTRPYMGLGLVENYRYTFTDDLHNLKTDTDEQIKTYLPEFADVNVEYDTVASEEKVLLIYIYIDHQVYTVSLDTDKKTLTWLINNTSSNNISFT